MAHTQKSRLLSLNTPLGEDKFLLTGFTGQEGLTRPSSFTLDTLVNIDDEIDPISLLGAAVNFDVELDEGGYRVFNGVVNKIIPKGVVNESFRRCQLHVVTQLDMMKRKSDHRIFQNQSGRDILLEILEEHGVKLKDLTSGPYPKHEYYVQYGETDFEFAHRILKETGINYWIQHETGKHTVTLFNDKATYRETTEPVIEYVDGDSAQRKFYNWNKDIRLNTGKVMQRSFDYMRPLKPVQSQTSTLVSKSAEEYEHYVYPALHNQRADSDSESQRHMETIESQYEVATVSTTCRSLEPGQTFSFDKHVIDAELEPSYVVTKIDYKAVDDTYLNQDSDTQKLESHLTCISKENNFRRQKQYPRPTVCGVQTAIVVGPKGEEINTDELGRVQVQFHWDRQSKRSSWIRVAQTWADKGFGEQYIPRIGHEVMVHFEDGDINKPVIMGSLYNGKNKPAYSLPENKTQSGIKTRSSKGADPAQFNELSFEDKKGQEEFKVQAQKHQTTLVKDSQSRAIGNNQTVSVGSSRFEVIKESRQTISVEGYDNLQVEKDISIHSVGGGIVAEAKNFIEFRAGGSTFTLNKNGTIVINGTLIDIDGTSAVNINGGNSPASSRLNATKIDKVFTTPTEKGTAVPKVTVTPLTVQPIQALEAHSGSRSTQTAQEEITTNVVVPLSPEEIAETGRFSDTNGDKSATKLKAKALLADATQSLGTKVASQLANAKSLDLKNMLNAESMISNAVSMLSANQIGGKLMSNLSESIGLVSQGKNLASSITQAITSVKTGEGVMSSLTSALSAIPNGNQLIPGLNDALAKVSKGQQLVSTLTQASSALDYLNAGNYAFREVAGSNAKIDASLGIINGAVSVLGNNASFNPAEVLNIYKNGQALTSSQKEAGHFLPIPSGAEGVSHLVAQEVSSMTSFGFTDQDTGLPLNGLNPGDSKNQKINTKVAQNADKFVQLLNG